MTSRPSVIALWVTVILCGYASVEAMDEAKFTVELLRGLFSMDVQVGG